MRLHGWQRGHHPALCGSLGLVVSEPDRGRPTPQQGIATATGDGWPGRTRTTFIIRAPSTIWQLLPHNTPAGLIIGDMMLIDEHDCPLRDIRYVKPSYKALLAEGMLLANQATFWRRSLQEKVGLLDEAYHCSFDYEWFCVWRSVLRGYTLIAFGRTPVAWRDQDQPAGAAFSGRKSAHPDGARNASWQKKLYKLRRLP